MLKRTVERTEELAILTVASCVFEDEDTFDDILAQAYRELEVSRRRAQMVLANARLEAFEICQQARAEAARIVELARVQAATEAASRGQQIEDEARRKGLEEGLGLAAAESKGALCAARQLKAGLESAYRKHLCSSERDIVETVLRIAEKVVTIQQEEFRDVLGSAIHSVLRDQSDAHDVTLVVNPADYEAVAGYLAEQEGVCDQIAGVAPTAAVPAGSCRFRSSQFNLDLSLSKRFEQVREHLRQQWELASPLGAE